MRSLFTLVIMFASLAANAQHTFLMYNRQDGHYLLTDTTTEFHDEPIFFADNIFTMEGTIGYSRHITIIADKIERKKRWTVDLDDSRISITGKDGKMTGRVLTTSIVDTTIFYDSQTRFLLIPIKDGVAINPLKGRYIAVGDNGKWTMIFKEIINKGNSKGLQITEIFEQSRNVTNEFPLTKYTTKEYGHLIYLGGMNKILVPISNDSDSIILFNSFPAQFQEPNLQLNTFLRLTKK